MCLYFFLHPNGNKSSYYYFQKHYAQQDLKQLALIVSKAKQSKGNNRRFTALSLSSSIDVVVVAAY